ncbi:hypothetical protein [Marinomonas sp. GJ51-6]|uniref:hypothetical protein n=1 Tax=Marinomonas sp. GJ51-6 TaxID=2992802 RepID=UPI0029345A51|nr:hypothetical protein [Marinomonas sp. GJ51-6]WOD08208.1 hypothetical protein ONZ50_03405 [Marinomonas sp. GJ51-6]
MTWDLNQQAVANAAAAGAAGAVTDAVIDAVTDEEEAEEAEPEEDARKGYVPDGDDPLNGSSITQNIQSDDPYYTPVYPNGMSSFTSANRWHIPGGNGGCVFWRSKGQ